MEMWGPTHSLLSIFCLNWNARAMRSTWTHKLMYPGQPSKSCLVSPQTRLLWATGIDSCIAVLQVTKTYSPSSPTHLPISYLSNKLIWGHFFWPAPPEKHAEITHHTIMQSLSHLFPVGNVKLCTIIYTWWFECQYLKWQNRKIK